jgi:hypothetical protein
VNFNGVPAHSKRSALEVEVIALVEDLDKLRQNLTPGDALSARFFPAQCHHFSEYAVAG